MPRQEMLLLAVARAPGGVCLAGMTAEPDPVTGLRWVRPVREKGPVLLSDITTAEGWVLQPFDVVEFHLLRARPSPPHCEDWIADLGPQQARVVRRLEGARRADFLRKHLDADPRQVLELEERSLCLVRPDWIRGAFRLDSYSGQVDAHLTFGLEGHAYRGSYAKGGLPVTDLKWRALGRAWLPQRGGWTEFDAADLKARLGVRETYLIVGLMSSRSGRNRVAVLGIHTLPDYEAILDYDNLY